MKSNASSHHNELRTLRYADLELSRRVLAPPGLFPDRDLNFHKLDK